MHSRAPVSPVPNRRGGRPIIYDGVEPVDYQHYHHSRAALTGHNSGRTSPTWTYGAFSPERKARRDKQCRAPLVQPLRARPATPGPRGPLLGVLGVVWRGVGPGRGPPRTAMRSGTGWIRMPLCLCLLLEHCVALGLLSWPAGGLAVELRLAAWTRRSKPFRNGDADRWGTAPPPAARVRFPTRGGCGCRRRVLRRAFRHAVFHGPAGLAGGESPLVGDRGRGDRAAVATERGVVSPRRGEGWLEGG